MPDTSMAMTIIPSSGADTYRMSTDAASISKAIVVKTAMEIQGRKYVKVEGWQAIALAHGCTASSCNVERVDGGFRATGQVRRMDTGATIAEAEGFVGEDEPTWFGGEAEVWDKKERCKVKKILPKRADYAIRAMAQTRSISRACRSAFAHVVVMMDAGLQTTPAEEVPLGGFDDGSDNAVITPSAKGTAGAGTQFRPERRQQSSWGEGGKAAVIEEAQRDGLTANAPVKPGVQINTPAAARNAIEHMQWIKDARKLIADATTKGQLSDWWRQNEEGRENAASAIPVEYDKLIVLFDEKMTTVARAGA